MSIGDLSATLAQNVGLNKQDVLPMFLKGQRGESVGKRDACNVFPRQPLRIDRPYAPTKNFLSSMRCVGPRCRERLSTLFGPLMGHDARHLATVSILSALLPL